MGINFNEIQEVFACYKHIANDYNIEVLNSGHINKTYLIKNDKKKYLLQNLNTTVFKNLNGISKNILVVAKHLKDNGYRHNILKLLPTKEKHILCKGHWRLIEYIENTQVFDKTQSVEQAFKTAKFLSDFHAHLINFNCSNVCNSVDGFLDFQKRFRDFEAVIKSSKKERLENAETEIDFLLSEKYLIDTWDDLIKNVPQRLLHADPKITNFLFIQEDQNKVVALIDWDTLLIGFIGYDFGDMVRSFTNLKREDDTTVGNNFNVLYYKALHKGFLSHLDDQLTKKEIDNLGFSSVVVIYIQAIRFLTDYLNNDKYYTVTNPYQNLNRAKNQINLLKGLQAYLKG